MTIPAATLFPRTGDTQTIYLKPAITDPNIQVGDYTMSTTHGTSSGTTCSTTTPSTGTS